MAKELHAYTTTGWTLYVILINSTGQVYNGSTFVTIAPANWATYDIAMTEATAGIYQADMPGVAADTYSYAVYRRLGGAPAITDTLITSTSIEWNGTGVTAPVGTNILTPTEASIVLRCDVTDTNMLQLLPIVDKYIEQATGRNWAADATIYNEAKAAARMLITRWHEDPGGMAAGDTLGPGIRAALTQLEALALDLETAGVYEDALALVGSVPAVGAIVATSITPVLIFNHEMAAGSMSLVTIEDTDGTTVTSTNTLDVTAKIMTLTPAAPLSASTSYWIIIDYAADISGLTLYREIGFTTA